MNRPGRRARQRRRLIAVAVVAGLALGAGAVFHTIELRGVTVNTGDGVGVADGSQSAGDAGAGDAGAGAALPAGGAGQDFARLFAEGIAQLRQGDAHGAAMSFQAARRANPHVPEAHLNLGFSYLELGQAEASRVAFNSAIEIAPGMARAYYGLAEAHEALGDLAAARGAMKTFVHLAPEDDRFRTRALAALWEWGEGDGAGPQGAGPQGAGPQGAGPAATVASASQTREPGRPAREPESQARAPDSAPSAQGSDGAILAAPLTTLDGEPVSLARHQGKIIVANVWASWCGPCRKELPSLDRLADALDPAPVRGRWHQHRSRA